MPGSRQVSLLDVFTDRALAGNGLAVVADADGIDDGVMLAFAQETRLSETTFVQSADDDADYVNRIWTPAGELPFAGHPSLGTAVAVARWEGRDRASLVQRTPAGLQEIDVAREGDGGGPELWRASMLQAETVHGPEADRAAVMSTMGLEPGDADPELPPQVVSTGLPHLIAPVSDESALARARPDYEAILALLQANDAGEGAIYLAWCEPGRGIAHARCFTGTIGEDPATGSAAGPLCAYLAARTGSDRVVIAQGAEIGRPSTLEAEIEDGRVRVSGGVVPLIDGSLRLPGR